MRGRATADSSLARPPAVSGAGSWPRARMVASCSARTSATTGRHGSSSKVFERVPTVGQLHLKRCAQRRGQSRSNINRANLDVDEITRVGTDPLQLIGRDGDDDAVAIAAKGCNHGAGLLSALKCTPSSTV